MELTAHTNTTIREIKEQFSRYFPFLNIEFNIYRHHTEDDLGRKEICRGIYLMETSDFFKTGTICFSPATCVSELELEFQIELGLAAKIYRRSIDTWVDTTQTAHLTLAKQNSMGGAVTRPRINLNTLFL